MTLRDRWRRAPKSRFEAPDRRPTASIGSGDPTEEVALAAGLVTWATTGEASAPIRLNRAGVDFFRMGPEVTREQLLTIVHGRDVQRFRAELRAALTAGGTHLIEARVTLDHDVERVVLVRLTVDLGSTPRQTAVRALQIDVTDQRLAERELLHRATHDALTGLANATLFNDRLDRAVGHARRSRSTVAALLVNLRGFGDINASLGHSAGDDLLRQIGERMQESLRDIDAVARLGGDEFGIVGSVADLGGARRLAERVREMLAAPFVLGLEDSSTMLSVRAAIGLAMFPQHTDTVGNLIPYATLAMADARRRGQPFAFYTPDLERSTRSRLRLLGDLHQAIDSSPGAPFGLSTTFAPVVDLHTHSIVWRDAQPRWRHPVHGEVEGDELQTLIEMGELHFTVAAWASRESAGAPFAVQVPISTRSIHGDPLDVWMERLLHRLPALPARLGVTLSQRELLADREAVVRAFELLRASGVQITLISADGGLGMIGHLGDLAVDAVTLDRSLVTRALSGRESIVARASIDLAHNLGSRVVAVDVQDARTLDALHRLGCDFASGPAVQSILEAKGATASS